MKHFWTLSNLPLSLPLKNTGRGCLASSPLLLWTYPCLKRAELGSTNSDAAKSPRGGRKKTDQGPRLSFSGHSKLCLVPAGDSFIFPPSNSLACPEHQGRIIYLVP